MRWTTLYPILAAAALSQSLIIPSHITEEGTYQVVTNTDGTEVHTKIANVTSSTPHDDGRALDRRDYGEIWCGCGYFMTPSNCDAAVEDMKHQLDTQGAIGAHLSFYSIRNDVVAFACNRADRSFEMSGQRFAIGLEGITDWCGRYVAGSADIGDYNLPVISGYMQYRSGLDFCGDSTRGASHTRC
jgi:hypothetical protein